MKNIIIFLALFIVFGAKAQTIDTAFLGYRSAKCTPFLKNPLLDTVMVTHVGIKIFHYDFTPTTGIKVRAFIEYALVSDSHKELYNEVKVLSDADYLAWFNAPDKNYWFFTYIRTLFKDNHGNPIITYQ